MEKRKGGAWKPFTRIYSGIGASGGTCRKAKERRGNPPNAFTQGSGELEESEGGAWKPITAFDLVRGQGKWHDVLTIIIVLGCHKPYLNEPTWHVETQHTSDSRDQGT